MDLKIKKKLNKLHEIDKKIISNDKERDLFVEKNKNGILNVFEFQKKLKEYINNSNIFIKEYTEKYNELSDLL